MILLWFGTMESVQCKRSCENLFIYFGVMEAMKITSTTTDTDLVVNEVGSYFFKPVMKWARRVQFDGIVPESRMHIVGLHALINRGGMWVYLCICTYKVLQYKLQTF